MTFDYGKKDLATITYVAGQVNSTLTTLRSERDTAISGLEFEKLVGKKTGYTLEDSPVTSVPAQKGNYFYVINSVVVDGVTIPANTILEYNTTSATAGVATNWDIDALKTSQLRGAISTITGEIGLVTPNDVISATERLSDIFIPFTFTGVADGTEALATVTDSEGNKKTYTLYVNDNSSLINLPATWMAGRTGPLIIAMSLTYAGVTISESKVIVLESVVIEVDPISTDGIVTETELQGVIEITGKAEANATVTITGDVATTAVADELGNWITSDISDQLSVGVNNFNIESGGVAIDRQVEVIADATAASVSSLQHSAINPASPSTTRVTVNHTGENMQVILRGIHDNSQVFELTKQNTTGNVTHFDISASDKAKLVAPSQYSAVLVYQGIESDPFEEAVTYQVVDSLPTNISTINFPTSGQNFHRKNTGFSEWYYDDGGDEKELHVWYGSNSHWYVGVRDFHTGQITNYKDIHNQCNITVRDDNHNTGACARSPDGTFLWVGDMHADDVQGGYCTVADDETFNSMVPITPGMFPADTADRVTYPQWFLFKGHLYLVMRELNSGAGTPNFISYIYRWREAQKDFVIAAELNAGVKLRFYMSNFAVSPDGSRLGMLGNFRDDSVTPNGTSQQKDLVYIYTDDDLSTGTPVWRSASGNVQQLPLKWDNGLGTEGVTAYFANDLVVNTNPDGIPNKAGTLVFDDNNDPHISTEIKNDTSYYWKRNAGNTAWTRYNLPFSENSSAMVFWNGVLGMAVHRGTNLYFHPMDTDHPKHTSGVLLATDVYSGGAFVYRPNYQAMYAGYLTANLFKNQSNGVGDEGSFVTEMRHRVIPFNQLEVEITDNNTSIGLFVDDIGDDGTITPEEATEEVRITGSVGEAVTITFNGAIAINPITLTQEGPFQSENIIDNILDEGEGVIEIVATTPDGRTASVTKSFSITEIFISMPDYNVVNGISTINKVEGESGILLQGLAPGSNGQTATFEHSHPNVTLPEYVVTDGKFNLELPAGELAKTDPTTTYIVKITISDREIEFRYQWHTLTFANTLSHSQYTSGDALEITSGTESTRGPWKFGLRITDIDDIELWPYSELISEDKPVKFNLSATDTDGWPEVIKLHQYNENVYRNGRTDITTITAASVRTNTIGVSVGDVELIHEFDVSGSQLQIQMSPIFEQNGYVYTANIHPGVNGDSDDYSLHTIAQVGIQLDDLTWDWTEQVIENRTVYDEYHSAPSIAVDSNNRVHITGNMHNIPWQSWKSVLPYDINEFEFDGQAVTSEELDRWKFQNKTNFPTFGRGAIPGNGITYPRYHVNGAGELYVTYRQAAKPAQSFANRTYSTGIAKYNALTGEWTAIGVPFVPVTDPDDYETDSRSPDFATVISGQTGWTASLSRLAFGPNDELHVVGLWIEGTASGTFTRPFHLVSTDDTNFTNADGSAITLPVTSTIGSASIGYADTVEFNSLGSIAVNSANKPYILVSQKVGGRKILSFNSGTSSWDTMDSPDGATEIFFDGNDNLYAMGTGLRILKQLSGQSTWSTVFDDPSDDFSFPRVSVNNAKSIAYIHTYNQVNKKVAIYALKLV